MKDKTINLAIALMLVGRLGMAYVAKPLPNVAMVDQDKKSFQLYDLKGKYLFITFIFSRCPMPKMCPLTMSLSNSLISQWKKSRMEVPLQVLAVTLDPEFDTPSILKKFGQKHHVDFSHFTLVTGNPQTLSDFASQFNVIGVPGEGTISHNMKK